MQKAVANLITESDEQRMRSYFKAAVAASFAAATSVLAHSLEVCLSP